MAKIFSHPFFERFSFKNGWVYMAQKSGRKIELSLRLGKVDVFGFGIDTKKRTVFIELFNFECNFDCKKVTDVDAKEVLDNVADNFKDSVDKRVEEVKEKLD